MDTDLTQSPRGYQTLKPAAHASIATWTLTATLLAHSATGTGSEVPASATVESAQACANAGTQADMNRCAYEDFEASGSGYAQRYKELSLPLPSAQRDRLRRMQTAWLKFRTEACRYESGPVTGGSVQAFVYWRCAARMTRERTLAMQALAACREGDITCTLPVP